MTMMTKIYSCYIINAFVVQISHLYKLHVHKEKKLASLFRTTTLKHIKITIQSLCFGGGTFDEEKGGFLKWRGGWGNLRYGGDMFVMGGEV